MLSGLWLIQWQQLTLFALFDMNVFEENLSYVTRDDYTKDMAHRRRKDFPFLLLKSPFILYREKYWSLDY